MRRTPSIAAVSQSNSKEICRANGAVSTSPNVLAGTGSRWRKYRRADAYYYTSEMFLASASFSPIVRGQTDIRTAVAPTCGSTSASGRSLTVLATAASVSQWATVCQSQTLGVIMATWSSRWLKRKASALSPQPPYSAAILSAPDIARAHSAIVSLARAIGFVAKKLAIAGLNGSASSGPS